MTRLKLLLLINLITGPVSMAWAGMSQAGSYVITKDLWGGFGDSALLDGSGHLVSLSAGEPWAGYDISSASSDHSAGYYAGWLGNGLPFQLLQYHLPATGPRLNTIQMGVALQAAIELDFSDQAQTPSLSSGITITLLQDHLGNPQQAAVPIQLTYDASGATVFIAPQRQWSGNTLYDISISSSIQNWDNNPLQNPTHILFLTVLDPQQQNVVSQPIQAIGPVIGAPSASPDQALPVSLTIPSQTFADYSLVLVNPNPLTSPLRIDPQIIRDANQRMRQEMGAYGTPLAIEEINAYGGTGQLMNHLSRPVQITLPFQTQLPIRPGHVSLWALDELHHLWVKIPDGQVDASADSMSASISQLAVFALIGSAAGDAQSTYVFPTPWRPHGPNAGTGPSQTGTTDGGMIFTNLPSECTISIYTLSGYRVKQLQHSDLAGSIAQEKWDGRIESGAPAASGVYLWRVESPSDAKNGKLMIIR